MMERERVQQSTRERVGSAARSRSGEFALSSSYPYSAKANFDIISSSRGSGDALRSWRHRSLTAAKAATGFTRNCVLGFKRKRPIFKCEARYEVAQSAFRALCVPRSVFHTRCLVVPLLRYGERYALFISTGANASAKVRNVEKRNNLKELGRTER